MLPSPLPVRLTGNRRIAAGLASDPAGSEHDIDRSQAVLYAMAVVLDAAGMHEKAGLCGPPPFRGLSNYAFGNSRYLRRSLWNPLSHGGADIVEANRMLANEVVVEPVVFDHQMENPVEQRRVAPWFDGQEQVTGSSYGRQAGIHDDHLGAVFARLPNIIGSDRGAFGNVRAADPHDFCAQDIAPGIGSAVDTERFFVRRRGAHHTEAPVVVDIGCL